MSTSEIKLTIDRMTEDERFFTAAYIQHLSRQQDVSHRSLLSTRMERMGEGRKVSMEQALKMHESLEGEGL